MPIACPALVGLFVINERRLGLTLPPRSAWRDVYGASLLPLALPGCAVPSGADERAEALSLAPTWFGQQAIPLASAWTYGPSERHAIDRTPAKGEAPFLRFERMTQLGAAGQAPDAVHVSIYRARLSGAPSLDPNVTAGMLWVEASALRALTGGERVADALEREGMALELAEGGDLPADGMLYLPSEFGERSLARVVAKYGADALFSLPDR